MFEWNCYSNIIYNIVHILSLNYYNLIYMFRNQKCLCNMVKCFFLVRLKSLLCVWFATQEPISKTKLKAGDKWCVCSSVGLNAIHLTGMMMKHYRGCIKRLLADTIWSKDEFIFYFDVQRIHVRLNGQLSSRLLQLISQIQDHVQFN